MDMLCKQCSLDMYGEDYGDFANPEEQDLREVECANCGHILIDPTGKKVSVNYTEWIED